MGSDNDDTKDKPKYRLSDLDVFEVSFVPKAANKRTFLMYKSADGGIEVDNEDNLADVETFKSEDFMGACSNCGYGSPGLVYKTDEDGPCPYCGTTED